MKNEKRRRKAKAQQMLNVVIEREISPFSFLISHLKAVPLQPHSTMYPTA